MQVTIDLYQHPQWRKKEYLEGYQLSVVVVFPDFKQDRCKKVVLRAPVTSFNDDLKHFHFEVPMPSTSAPWILFLGVAGAVKGVAKDVPTTKAMAVVKVSGM